MSAGEIFGRALRSAPLPEPEDVFMEWLVSLPRGADLEAAALRQIGLIDRRAPLGPQGLRLRALFAAVAVPEIGPKPAAAPRAGARLPC
jgi:hypothetical protein